MPYKKILVALDGLSQSQVVFDNALAIAKQDGATLMLFHCLSVESPTLTPYTIFYTEEMTNFSRMAWEQVEKETEQTRHWLARYAEIASEQGVAAEWDWKVGEAGRWIRELAKSWEADLIVIGRRGLRGISEMFLGSVSNYIIHHVNCSVLVVQGVEDT
jgi:nucleotide-binding universal stress UspA family protein